jgi:hypothetical protein
MLGEGTDLVAVETMGEVGIDLVGTVVDIGLVVGTRDVVDTSLVDTVVDTNLEDIVVDIVYVLSLVAFHYQSHCSYYIPQL